MQVSRRAGAGAESALRADEPEQVRARKLRLHRMFQRRHRHRRLALFGTSRVQFASARRELYEHEALPRRPQALPVRSVLLRPRCASSLDQLGLFITESIVHVRPLRLHWSILIGGLVRLAAWHLTGGPVGLASRWAATSNVQVSQTTYSVNRGSVGREVREGS